MASNPAPLHGAADVFFDMLAADDQFSFDVQKRSHQGMILGKRKESLGTWQSVLYQIFLYII